MDEANVGLDREIQGQGIFVGTYRHALDQKRRLTIPSEWRSAVGEPKSLYVLPDTQEPCLRVLPYGEMTHRVARVRQHSMGDGQARRLIRALGSQADLVTWDVQGRIRIKDHLLDFARIEGEATLVGTFETFELWNPALLEQSGLIDREHMREAARSVDF